MPWGIKEGSNPKERHGEHGKALCLQWMSTVLSTEVEAKCERFTGAAFRDRPLLGPLADPVPHVPFLTWQRDFVLTMSNAQTFNPPGSLYCNEAKRLESWGLRAIEREGLSAVLPDFESKAAADGSPAPRGKTIKLGSRLSASAHERSTSTGAYIPAAQAFGVSSPGAGMLGGVKQEDRDASLELGEGELDDGMEDDAVSDAESSVRGMSRERSMTRDGGKLGQRAIARLSNGTPSTPSQVSRQVSPETMRKRLASAKSE